MNPDAVGHLPLSKPHPLSDALRAELAAKRQRLNDRYASRFRLAKPEASRDLSGEERDDDAGGHPAYG